MFHANNGKWQKRNNRRNKTAKPATYQNIWREKNYKYLGILESDIIKQTDMKEKKIRKITSEEKQKHL